MFLRAAVVCGTPWRRFFRSGNSRDLICAVAELNQEMEMVFGEPPSGGLFASVNESSTAKEINLENGHHTRLFDKGLADQDHEQYNLLQKTSRNEAGLSHVSSNGKALMVDVSSKESTKRTAVARCKVMLSKKVHDMILQNQMEKGDVLTVAKIAGINGAKHTSSLIPLCHNIALSHVRVDLLLNSDDFCVEIEGEAASTGKTGVEMEAMTAVTTAALAVYDMCKAASREIQITDIRLERKTGGNSGEWKRGE